MSTRKKNIRVANLPIRLGQLLKLTALVQDGFEAKMRIQNGEVKVNNQVEMRRGRQLADLDEITLDGETWVIEDAS